MSEEETRADERRLIAKWMEEIAEQGESLAEQMIEADPASSKDLAARSDALRRTSIMIEIMAKSPKAKRP